jgi:replication factor C subunit 2/4
MLCLTYLLCYMCCSFSIPFTPSVTEGKMKDAQDIIMGLWSAGYAATDIIQTLFKVTRAYDMPEPLKLDMLREIGFSHMRIAQGLNTQLQLLGCVARMTQVQVKFVTLQV